MICDWLMQAATEDDLRNWGKDANWYLVADNHRLKPIQMSEEFMREMEDYIIWNKTWQQIKSIDFIRENRNRLNWKLLSEYYPFTKEQLKEFRDYIDWDVVAKWNKLDNKIIEYFWEKLDCEELLCNYTVKMPKPLEKKIRFFVYGHN